MRSRSLSAQSHSSRSNSWVVVRILLMHARSGLLTVSVSCRSRGVTGCYRVLPGGTYGSQAAHQTGTSQKANEGGHRARRSRRHC
jgi:hypothetical protein